MKLDKKLGRLINILVSLEDSLNINIVTWGAIKQYSSKASCIDNKDNILLEDKQLLNVACACNLNTFSLVLNSKDDKILIAFECKENNAEDIGEIIETIMQVTETPSLIVKTGGIMDLIERENIMKYIRGDKY